MVGEATDVVFFADPVAQCVARNIVSTSHCALTVLTKGDKDVALDTHAVRVLFRWHGGSGGKMQNERVLRVKSPCGIQIKFHEYKDFISLPW